MQIGCVLKAAANRHHVGMVRRGAAAWHGCCTETHHHKRKAITATFGSPRFSLFETAIHMPQITAFGNNFFYEVKGKGYE